MRTNNRQTFQCLAIIDTKDKSVSLLMFDTWYCAFYKTRLSISGKKLKYNANTLYQNICIQFSPYRCFMINRNFQNMKDAIRLLLLSLLFKFFSIYDLKNLYEDLLKRLNMRKTSLTSI